MTPSQPPSPSFSQSFDQEVILRQPQWWSRAILWTIMGVTASGIIWACVAPIGNTVSATGQLKPLSKNREVQAPPVNGVVKAVKVKDGETVTAGQVLVVLDTTATQAQRKGLETQQESLNAENEFYRTLMASGLNGMPFNRNLVQWNFRPEVLLLAKNWVTLQEERRFLKALLSGQTQSLTMDQLARLQANRSDFAARVLAGRLDVEQLTKQLQQVQTRLGNANQKLATQKRIYNSIASLEKDGAIGSLQIVNQAQEVNNAQADVMQLQQEKDRLRFAIGKAQEDLTSTVATYQKEVRDRLADNQKQLADLDSQFNKTIVENNKRLADIQSQLTQTDVTIRYQNITAPISGVVFDLKAAPGYVPNSGRSEPLLKIVPQDNLVAEVLVTSKDIGFVINARDRKEQINADVRIDSFSYSDFGEIAGHVTEVGSDALPPDETYRFYRFPVKISLKSQDLKGLKLQSGMSVTANIRVGEKRTLMSLFIEGFRKKWDALGNTR